MVPAVPKGNAFAAPTVDRLSVRVVVDSAYDRFMPKAEHPVVGIEHVRHIPGRQMSTLAGEWGLSLHLESSAGGRTVEYLLDFGYTPEILNRNFDLLGIQPNKLNGLILSHAHRDHYGGLDGFIGHYRSHMADDMELIIGGDGVFRERFIKDQDGEMISWGAPDEIMLRAQKVLPVCCETPHVLHDHGPFTSGYIDRTTFETVTGGSMVNDDHFTAEERTGKLVLDEHPEEHATCYVIQGRGLVVISSCGHTGIINTIKTSMAVANVDKLHAVIGGFHLGAAPQDYVEHTVDEMERLQPDVVVPMHCSGAKFIDAMRRRMPDQLATSNLGSRFSFGA